MMNKPDIDAENSSLRPAVLRVTKLVIASALFLFSAGLVTGGTMAVVDGTANPLKAAGILSVGTLIVVASGWWFWKLKPLGPADEPISASTRRTRRYFALSLGFGVLLGMGFAMSGLINGDPASLLSNEAIPRTPALALSAAYIVALPILGWLWHRSIDEHENAANSKGALAGIYAYSMIAPVWWVGERAGYLPPQQPMTVFVIVMIVWGLVWAVSRRA
ncbi:hypothetical protein [Qipengyuania huizhouensis]|uniref:hypothetical protein n=1 Tax=Qipengyuania huizhouensis TaxID=2867245 RepID=UPI00181812CE|nr:hypothetical protein [Qipengyuania huizhouensis]MBA4765848.1 hypothetical protein [Erythrobacter sp.]MBX7460462.1 hypothetical protein [Qipengyuania huizhouensis]